MRPPAHCPRAVLAPLLVALLAAAPSLSAEASGPIRLSPSTSDASQRSDANRLSMVLTNFGSFAYDITTGSAGLEFPKGSSRTAMFAAGLWVGARVAGGTRLATAEYSFEYGPGPMIGGGPAPDAPEYKVYKVAADDTTGWADWVAHAGPQGAPVTPGGTRPLISGSQTLWTVFNDANPSLHTNEAGSTAPLGLEVRETAWSWNEPGLRGNVIFLRFLLINGGSNTLDSAYVGLWSDPDLGGFTDDLTGCDVSLDLGYCYNSTNNDAVYGLAPPAVGIKLIAGPHDPVTGERLPMTSFIRYINGTDPNSADKTYNFLRGLNGDGTPIVNPVTTLPTTYMMSGDPVTATGWLDDTPSDRRFLIGSGPFTLGPGQSDEVVAAVIMGQGHDRLSSITALRASAQSPTTDAPLARAVGLELAIGPNPVIGPVTVTFAPAAGESWRLDAFDLSGRRVSEVARGEGRGAVETRRFDLARGELALRPGIYWLRLASGSRSVARRVVVLEP